MKRILPAWLVAAVVAAGTLFALGAPAAHADLQNPRQQFLRDSVGGPPLSDYAVSRESIYKEREDGQL